MLLSIITSSFTRPADTNVYASGDLVANSDGAFYLQGGTSNPYNIPVGGLLPYVGGAVPNSAFALPYGQAISRATYGTLFSIVSTTFGSGDGSTTFNLPDLRGRVIAGLDNMGGSSATRLSSAMTSTSMGNTGGAQQVTLGTSNLPPYTPAGSLTNVSSMTIGVSQNASTAASGAFNVGGGLTSPFGTGTLANIAYPVNPGSVSWQGNAQGGTSTPFNSIPPTMVANFILRII